jgi:hypothetical protein
MLLSTQSNTHQHHPHSLTDDHLQNGMPPCAERHAYADLRRTLRHKVGDDSINTDHCEQDGGRGEDSEQRQIETPAPLPNSG